MVFDTWMENECRIVVLGFGGMVALLGLFHVAFLDVISFRKVFGNTGGCETRKSSEVAVWYCNI